WLPARTAAAAAADWGGDRLAAFADDTRRTWAVGWHLRFDTTAAAERAFTAFARAAPLTERGSHPGPLPDDSAATQSKRDKLCLSRHTQGPIALVRRGPDLAV